MNETLTLSSEDMTTLRDLLNLSRALTESTSTSVIVRMASAINNFLPLLELLENPGFQKLAKTVLESSDNLAELIQLLNEYQKAGSLQTAFEMLGFIGALKDSLTTSSIAHTAEGAVKIMVAADQLISETGGLKSFETLLAKAKQAASEANRDKGEIGIVSLLKLLKEPQIQKGIRFLVHFSRKIGESK